MRFSSLGNAEALGAAFIFASRELRAAQPVKAGSAKRATRATVERRTIDCTQLQSLCTADRGGAT